MRPQERFDVSVSTTEEVFGTGSVSYDIPQFQRAYAWTKEEIDDLLGDLFDDLDLQSENPRKIPPHFLGSLVLSKSEAGHSLSILDGQQRLTTISILLAIIARKLKDCGAEDHGEISKHLLVGRIGQKKRPVLTLQNADHDLYLRILEDPYTHLDSIEERTPLGLAVDRIRRDLDNRITLSPAATISRREALLRVAERILYEVTFVKIATASESAAFALFETLNHRGLPLNAADLIKNRLLAQAGDYFQEVVRNWEETIRTVGAKELVNYLRYYWIARFKFVRKSNLFEVARTKLQQLTPSEINVLSQDLRHRAVEYKHIAHPQPDSPDWPELWPTRFAEALKRLNDFKAKSCRPLLIAVAQQPMDLCFALEFAEIITLRHSVIADGNANTLEQEYQAVCMLLRKQVSVQEALKKRFGNTVPTDTEFRSAIMKARMRRVDRAWRRILLEINRHISTGETTVLGPEAVHIEHILPQRLSATWRTDSQLSATKHAEIVGALGNLTLLHARKNVRASNRPISEKLRQYKTSEITLTRKIFNDLHPVQPPRWGEVEIKQRTAQLADLMLSIWPTPTYEVADHL